MIDSKFTQKYKVLKLLCSDYKINCYIATKNEAGGDGDNQSFYLINEICDRPLINHYLSDIMDCDQKKVPEFVEYFSESSRLYVVFQYHQGTMLAKALETEKMPTKMRVALLKNILHNMISQGSYPNVVKTNALHIENINFDDNSISLNYRFFSVETEPENNEQVFMSFDRLLNSIFSSDEIKADNRLVIISEKCNKGIYHSFGEVMKDLEDAEKVVDEKANRKEALKAKKNQMRGLMGKIFVVLVAVAAVVVLIDTLTANKAVTNIYNDLTKIGSTYISEKDESVTYEDVYISTDDVTDNENLDDANLDENADATDDAVGATAGATEEVVEDVVEEPVVEVVEPEVIEPVEEVVEPEVEETVADTGSNFVYVDPNLFYDVHTIQEGESLMAILRDYYGDLEYYDEVIAFNKIENPSLIKYGFQLKLPIFEY